MNTNLTLLMLNCKSINSKLGEIKLLCYSEKPDIFCLSETWIKEVKYEPKFINYSIEWKHRVNPGGGGGLGILIKRGVQYHKLNLIPFPNGVLEFLAIKIYENNNKYTCILNIYNPGAPLSTNEFRHYINQLGSRYIVLGDFNAHSIILNDRCKRRNATGKTIEELVLDDNICLINPINFFTFIDSATGCRSCLDLCFASPNIAINCEISLAKDVGSDHYPVKVEVNIAPIIYKASGRPKWKPCKESLYNFSMNISETKIIQPNSLDNMVSDLQSRIHDSALQNIKQTKGIRVGKRTSWWSEECSRAVAERRYARKQLEKYPTNNNLLNFRDKSSKAKDICLKHKKATFQNYISSLHHNTPTSQVWKKVKSLKSNYKQESYPLA